MQKILLRLSGGRIGEFLFIGIGTCLGVGNNVEFTGLGNIGCCRAAVPAILVNLVRPEFAVREAADVECAILVACLCDCEGTGSSNLLAVNVVRRVEFLVTAAVTAIMLATSTFFPKAFYSMGSILLISLSAVVIVELILVLILGMTMPTLWHVIVAFIFCGYIGYDWATAQNGPYTVDNAIDVCVDLYLDIVHKLAAQYGIDIPEAQLDIRAEAHAIRNGGRSPRVAKQFIELPKAGI